MRKRYVTGMLSLVCGILRLFRFWLLLRLVLGAIQHSSVVWKYLRMLLVLGRRLNSWLGNRWRFHSSGIITYTMNTLINWLILIILWHSMRLILLSRARWFLRELVANHRHQITGFVVLILQLVWSIWGIYHFLIVFGWDWTSQCIVHWSLSLIGTAAGWWISYCLCDPLA